MAERRAERRLASIFAGDVAGNGKLSGKPVDADASAPDRIQNPDSISFVITAPRDLREITANLETLRSQLCECDEVIVLTGIEPTETETPGQIPYSLVVIPDASVFTLRAHIPAVCHNEWVVLIEDHALVNPPALRSIRELIRTNSELDMIVFLAKNLTSISPWGWAIFLFNFTLVWAPLGEAAPPFSPVTSAVIRRAKFGTDAPLREGVWELQLIPKIYSEGKFAYGNAIYFDHVRHVNFVSAVILEFHNARAGAAFQRSLGVPISNILYEGWHCAVIRPGMLAAAAASRLRQLPAGTFQRIRVVSIAHFVGYFAGLLLGGGRSAQYL